MNTYIAGPVLKYGDNINTDIISPPQYMEMRLEEASRYTMGGIDPDFAEKCTENTILVAGYNFGSGSSRETAPLALKYLGIRLIIAKSFARIFYRNAINLGIVVLECGLTDGIQNGDILEVDPVLGTIRNKNDVYLCQKMPEHILGIIANGGLAESIKKQIGGNENERST